jgi:glutathione S-transferase
MKIFGDSISGNCLKVKWAADHLGLDYEWAETSVLSGETRTPSFLAMNPAGQVPVVILDDGRPLAQSNAIILHLAWGSELIPSDPYERARMLEWMFWEQYSHEPYVAVARFQVRYLGTSPDAVAGRFSLADMALLPYTRFAPEAGLSLGARPHLSNWIKRCEGYLGLSVPGGAP